MFIASETGYGSMKTINERNVGSRRSRRFARLFVALSQMRLKIIRPTGHSKNSAPLSDKHSGGLDPKRSWRR